MIIGDVIDVVKIVVFCIMGGLECVVVQNILCFNGVYCDIVIYIINDFQRDFYLEFVLVVGV